MPAQLKRALESRLQQSGTQDGFRPLSHRSSTVYWIKHADI